MNISYVIDECPVCKTICNSGLYDHEDKKEVDCERCGKYKISLGGLSLSDVDKYKNGLEILSYYIKNFLKEYELLDRNNINLILKNYQLPNYQDKFKNLLLWLVNESEYSTKSITGNSNILASIIGAVNGTEVIEILDDIWTERLIEVEEPSGGSLRKLGPTLGFKVHLTPNGIKKSRENYIKPISELSTLKYDAFISHASEDKVDFVRPLAEKLLSSGFKIWYDDFQLQVGDSLRRTIDKGLANSRFGIVVLSPSFFAKNWPQYELDGLVTKEINGEKVILPVWYKVSKDEVMNYSLSLADKVALQPSIHTIDEIVEQLSNVLK